MGALVSMTATVWETFSLPYKAGIVVSFFFWVAIQRSRYPGALVRTVIILSQVLWRHLLGKKKNHVTYTLLEEGGVEVARDLLQAIDKDVITSVLALKGALTPRSYPLKFLQTNHFKANWYGVDHPDSKILLYIHGGGYVFGHSLQYLDYFTKLLQGLSSKGKNFAILSLEYSLAPSSSFPTQLNEAVAAYQYLLTNLSISPKRIVVGGDSAGGALALALCYQIRESLPPPGSLLLFSPWVDSRDPSRYSQSPNIKSDILSVSLTEKGVTDYLQHHQQNHLSSPILGNTQGLPKMFVVYGGLEIFRDDIEKFIKKVKEENGETSVEIYLEKEGFHIFNLFFQITPQKAQRALDWVVDSLTSSFSSFE